MKADLHMHTTNSDGKLTPFEVIDRAKNNGIDIISITDHDVIQHVNEIKEYAEKQGIKYIPGIELSTKHMDKPVHILGYFTDESYLSDEVVSFKEHIRKRRENRSKEIISRLKTYDQINVTYEGVKSFSSGIIARPHIAKEIKRQYPQYTIDEIFEKFLCDECNAYVPSAELSVVEGLDFLKRNNCIAVLAHPVLLKDHIKEYVLSQPYDGLEAIYFLNTKEEETYFKQLAKEKNIIITAGSDYHGLSDDTKHGDIGDRYLSGKELQAFLELLKGEHNEG